MPTLLMLTVFLPLAGAFVLVTTPKMSYILARRIALITVLATLVFSLILSLGFQTEKLGYQFAFSVPWMAVGSGSIRFALGLDGISLALFVLSTVLMVPSVFASWESVKEGAAIHYGLMLALETGLLGLFSSLDVILFYIFFEFTLIPLFFLIGLYGGPERKRAAITFFLYTLAGSLLTLLGVISLVVIHQQYSPSHVLTFSIPELTQGLATLPWAEWSKVHTWADRTGDFWFSPQVLIFLLLFAGFAIKVPLFPFHTWLPLAHVEAPTAGSILLAGVLLKVGGYGFLRFNMAMVPLGAQALFPLLALICVVGILYGAFTALAQTDIKRLVAYSSVSHMGFIALGIFSMTKEGMDGAAIQMINHGITTGALFACVGVIYERYHTREMSEMSGLWQRLPLLAFFFILASLGSAAVPGLNGFVGEFPILLGMFARDSVFAVFAALGMILGAYYLMIMLQNVIFGPLHEPGGHAHEPVRPVGWHEIAGLSTLMVLIVAIGVYPKPIFQRINSAVEEIAKMYPDEPGTKTAKIQSPRTIPSEFAALPQERAR